MISLEDVYKVVVAMVPLYVALILGYGSVKWWRIFTPEQCDAINKLVCYFTLPLFNFDFTAHSDPFKWNYRFLAADAIGKVIIFAVIVVWAKCTSKGSYGWSITSFSLSTLTNSLVVGVPLLKAMYGRVGVDLVVQFSVTQAIIWLTVLLFVLEFRRSRSDFPVGTVDVVDQGVKDQSQIHSIGVTIPSDLELGKTIQEVANIVEKPSLWALMKRVWVKLIINPNSYSCIIGIAWAALSSRLHFQMPSIIDGSILIMSKAGTGTAMFSMASSPIDWSSMRTLDVVKQFGARNDGKTDTKQALLNAWSVACSSDEPSQIYVPSGQYSLSSLTFEGSCKSPGIMLKIDGTLVASDLDDKRWIVFHQVDTLYIKGGVLDAKGKSVWDCKRGSHQGCPHGATSLSFDNSKNIIVDGLTSTDSQMFHMSINACENMEMSGLSITADGDSPNTDGIHVAKSTGITITHSRISTGDDCISMGPNNQNIWIENILCGPGHGISIGSLGRDDGLVVQNVTVKSVTFTGTDNGLRIKTFATPVKGTVKDIYFSQATMVDARNPIIIDQNYCPQDDCPTGKGSGIQISNVVYEQIHGTSSSKQVVTLDCSPEKPCYGLTMNDIKLTYKSDTPECEIKNASGKVIGPMEPSKCLNW